MRLWYFGCHRRALGHPSLFIFFLPCCSGSKYLWEFVCFPTQSPQNQDFWIATLPLCYCCVWDVMRTSFFFFFYNFDSHIFSLANIYFFCSISAQDLPLFVKNAGAGVLIWEMKRRLGMSAVFQMPRATNWPNRETLWQLCERADAEEKKWLGHDREDAPWCF